jgi:dihydrofolate reductase
MRKIIVSTFITLDGVMQAPGSPTEDPSGGFKYGGWQFPHSDQFLEEVEQEILKKPYDLLLGRKTYDIFANYWPYQDEKTNPFAKGLNNAKKYVASHSPLEPEWKNSERIVGDAAAFIKNLKAGDGLDLQVIGSGKLVQTLLKNNLVDDLWLQFNPLTLGSGKRLFAEGTIPVVWELIETKVSPKGVIVAFYKRGGEVVTGSF